MPVHRISAGASAASSAASGAVAGASFGPWGALIASGLSLGASFISGGDDSTEVILKTLHQMYDGIIQSIREDDGTECRVSRRGTPRPEWIKDQVDTLQYYQMLNFFRTSEQIGDLQSAQAHYQEETLQYLGAYFDTLNQKMDSMLLQERFKASSFIDDWTTRKGKPLGELDEKEIDSLCTTLEDGLRVKQKNPGTIPNSNSQWVFI